MVTPNTNVATTFILWFTEANSLVYEIETENIYDDFSKNKQAFDFSNFSSKPKYYNDSNALVVGKMKDETAGVAIEKFVGLKPKMYTILVSDSSEYRKDKHVNKNVVAKVSHCKYKDVLMNTKCLRHSMNRIYYIYMHRSHHKGFHIFLKVSVTVTAVTLVVMLGAHHPFIV